MFIQIRFYVYEGGVAELEKQLNIKDGSAEVTTPVISKSLYNKVLKIPSNRYG